MNERKPWIGGALPYLAWLVSSALTVLCWAVLRTTTMAAAGAARRALAESADPETARRLRWAVAAVDPFTVFGLGLLGLGLVLAFEYIYRKAHRQGRLWRTFGLVTGIQAGLLLVCALVLALLRA